MQTVTTPTIDPKLIKWFTALPANDQQAMLGDFAPNIANMLTSSRFAKYRRDPVGFGEQELGEAYTDDIKTVMESVRDNPVTIARSGNATGKTHAAARIAIWWYKTFPGGQVYTTAAPPERNLKTLLWGEINKVVINHPALFENDRPVSLGINDPADPQHFIQGVSIPMAGTPEQREAKFSGKHSPYLLFIVDEGDAVPVEVYKAIESSMSGGHARLLIMFNPRAEQGVVYQKERDKLANVVELSALDHPNVITGEDIIPGAVTRAKTVERFNKWTRALASGEQPDAECVEVPAFLVGCTAPREDGGEYPPLPAGQRKVEEPAFWYMVMARYPAQGENQLISRAWLDAARSRYDAYVAQFGAVPPKGVQPVIGLDVADMGRDWNRLALRYGGYVPPLLGWQGLDTDLTADEGAKYYQLYEARQANVDGTGVGAGVAPKMSRAGCNAQKVMVASSPTYATEMGEFYQLRDQLWWSVREWLRADPGAMLPADEELLEDLSAPKYEIKNGKIKVTDKDRLKAQLGRSPDKGDALGLTFAPEVEFSLGFA